MIKNKLYYIYSILLIVFSCTENILDEEFSNTPLGNYDAIWDELDKTYGAFEAKKINWDSLYPVYRSLISDKSSDTELFSAVSGLLSNLNDGHVQLTASGFKKYYSSGNRTHFPDSKNYENNEDIIKLINLDYLQYLSNPASASSGFFNGFINRSYSGKNIGYLHVPSFSYDYETEFCSQSLKKFENANAIIVDVRFNGGGLSKNLLHLLNKFADKKRMYLQSRYRSGKKHNDFTNYNKHYTWPETNGFTPKPVIVIVNKHSMSSAEHFMLGMKAFPYVTVIGDSTWGALSEVTDRVMPNGWQFRTCPAVIYDTLGNVLRDSKGRYPDGIGLCPDVLIINRLSDINKNYDYVLEKAIEIINKRIK